MAEQEKGLRFEVYPESVVGSCHHEDPCVHTEWAWQLVGAEGPVCKSATSWDTEKEARSHLQANKGRMGNAKRCKVITVEAPTEVEIND